jgi:hypothetical protein
MQGTITVEDGSLSAFDAGEKVSFTVFPNPVSDVLKWKWNRDVAPTKADFKLYDLTGQIAAEFSMLRVGEYDVRGFPAGVYHYQVDQGEGKLHTGKLFIQRR